MNTLLLLLLLLLYEFVYDEDKTKYSITRKDTRQLYPMGVSSVIAAHVILPVLK